MRPLTPSAIVSRIPRLPLGIYPTPLMPAQTLRRRIGGPELWLKRDDLIGFGLGGNKIRALEVIADDVLKQGCDVMVTGAGPQSNHVRATAAVASHLGLDCAAIFWGDAPARADGNFRVTRMLGARMYFTGDPDRASVDAKIEAVAAELAQQGRRPYAIPRGGACALGTLGHVLAVSETQQQCRQLGLEPDAVILATGSGGTQAGWLLGTRALALPWSVAGFSVSRGAAEARARVARLANEAAACIGLAPNFSPQDAVVDDTFIGAGYGLPSPEGADAIRRVIRSEGVLFDPTYTGKALAGYLAGLESGRFRHCRTVLFLHSGGEPAFFAGDGKWCND